jgi:hypothetical protein
MPALVVEISRFVDAAFPGFVECVLIDANGQSHRFIEKVPYISKQSLSVTSVYPCPGLIDCEIEAMSKTKAGCLIVHVNTEKPWGVVSTTGQTQFLVEASQLIPC